MTARQGATRAIRAVAVALFLLPTALIGVARADHQVTELVSTGPAGGNAAVNVGGFKISQDGLRSFFATSESLVASDTDAERDLYGRAGGVTTLLSTGPIGGNGPFGINAFLDVGLSADGAHVAFLTGERLTADDTDDQVDLYERVGETTRLVSIGVSGGNGPFDVVFPSFMSRNGTSIVFETSEQLTTDDANAVSDFYLRRGGETTLLTKGAVTNREYTMHYVGMSADGRRVFFSTPRALTGTDNNGAIEDTYKWEDGVVTIESVGTNGESGTGGAQNFTQAIDETGSRLASSTSALDPAYEVGGLFERAKGVTRLVSVGPNGPVSSAHPAGISADGSHIYFYTYQSLVDADTDSEEDIYVHAGGVTRLVTGGPVSELEPGLFHQGQHVHGISADGRRAVFDTNVRLTPGDTDGGKSIYENFDGVTRWLAPYGLRAGVSADATRVFIATHDALVPADTDGGPDLYEIHDGRPSLISVGPAGSGGDPCMRDFGHPIVISCPVSVSRDGRRLLFWHSTPLLAGDTDFRYDVYMASVSPQRSEYADATSFCEAEQEYLGSEAFRQRYGKGSKGANAFKKCVHSNR